MKRTWMIARGLGLLTSGLRGAAALEAGFAQPPEQTKPWSYSYWISDHLLREGLTRDLARRKKGGHTTYFFGDIGCVSPYSRASGGGEPPESVQREPFALRPPKV